MAYNIVQLSLRQTRCPDHLLGRMNATMRTVMWAPLPVGGILGGVLGSSLGLRPTLWIGAVGPLLAALWLVFSPITGRFRRRLDDSVDFDEASL